MKTFWVLMRKDRRLYRSAVIATVIFVIVPYLFVLPEMVSSRVPFVLTWALPAGMLVLVIAAAIFGGLSFAGEKRNRADEFLAILPASRLQIIVGKLLVSAVCLSIACGSHAMAFDVCCWFDPRLPHDLFRLALTCGLYVGASAGMFVFAFGLAWLLSTLLDSAAIAATCSVATTAAIYGLIPLSSQSGLLANPNWFIYAGYDRPTVVGVFGILPCLLCVSAGALIFRKQFSS